MGSRFGGLWALYGALLYGVFLHGSVLYDSFKWILDGTGAANLGVSLYKTTR